MVGEGGNGDRIGATAVASGANHSVVLGEDGHAYAFGSNEYGQCGIGLSGDEQERVLSPTRIKLPKDAGHIVRISAGYAHTIVEDCNHNAYSFGQNESGQLALGKAAAETPSIAFTIPTAVEPVT